MFDDNLKVTFNRSTPEVSYPRLEELLNGVGAHLVAYLSTHYVPVDRRGFLLRRGYFQEWKISVDALVDGNAYCFNADALADGWWRVSRGDIVSLVQATLRAQVFRAIEELKASNSGLPSGSIRVEVEVLTDHWRTLLRRVWDWLCGEDWDYEPVHRRAAAEVQVVML